MAAVNDGVGDREVRRRRPPGEVRKLLLESARESFTESGYAGTPTRNIADRAGVSEALLFRHFGTKAKLFDIAMLEPYNEFVSEFMEVWREQLEDPRPTEDMLRAFIAGLYEIMDDNRELILALIAARAFDRDVKDSSDIEDSELSRQLDRFDELVEAEAVTRPSAHLDHHVTFRAIVGMVVAIAVLDDWLLPRGDRKIEREHLLEEMLQFVLYGVIGHRPGRPAKPAPDRKRTKG